MSWKANESELLWWSQVDVTHGKPPPDRDPAYSNWAHTGSTLTDLLATGNWERAEYRLWNDTNDWTYAGTNRSLDGQGGRGYYVYSPLDEVLTHLDVDVFHVLTFFDNTKYPQGSIDFDELDITYRNHSRVFPPNGAKVTSTPAGADDPATLTDGWRVGPGKTWKGAPSPQGPQEVVFELGSPITIQRVQIAQNPEFPAKNVEVMVSADGETFGDPIVARTLPDPATTLTPSFAYTLDKELSVPAKKIKLRILSGYRSDFWGLGEFEVFGTGAALPTDDDWVRVNADVTKLERGKTYHYRLVAEQDGKAELGGDLTFTVPADAKPEVLTGAASRIADGNAKIEGRYNTLGQEAQVWFDYGPDTGYGSQTPPKRAGQDITPRTFVGNLTGLAPGSVVHYRLVAQGALGTTYGRDQSFSAK
ncbi:MAG: discoidin domain-containing protein [Rubrivivax sp.]